MQARRPEKGVVSRWAASVDFTLMPRSPIFLHRVTHKVRSDCTVRWDGGFVQVPGECVGQKIELRFAPLQPAQPPTIFVELDYITDEYTALLRAFGEDRDDAEDER